MKTIVESVRALAQALDFTGDLDGFLADIDEAIQAEEDSHVANELKNIRLEIMKRFA